LFIHQVPHFQNIHCSPLSHRYLFKLQEKHVGV
jgi:hypothetical protein